MIDEELLSEYISRSSFFICICLTYEFVELTTRLALRPGLRNTRGSHTLVYGDYSGNVIVACGSTAGIFRIKFETIELYKMMDANIASYRQIIVTEC